jgi:flagellar biosynthesis regulator FlbT
LFPRHYLHTECRSRHERTYLFHILWNTFAIHREYKILQHSNWTTHTGLLWYADDMLVVYKETKKQTYTMF